MLRLTCLLLTAALCALAQDPVDYDGWLNQGIRHFQAAEYQEAVASFEHAVAIAPSKVTAQLYLGAAYMQQYIPGSEAPENVAIGERAEGAFRRVLEFDPSNKIAISSIASLNINQKKFDQALDWYGKLIAADPGNADAYYTLGFIAWSKWYPVYRKARTAAGLKQEDPGPIPDPAVRDALNREYGPLLNAGIDALNRALEINPQYSDAMAYLNLLIRERADLRDTQLEYRQDVLTADAWVEKALEAKKAKAAARGALAPPPPPPPPPPPHQ